MLSLYHFCLPYGIYKNYRYGHIINIIVMLAFLCRASPIMLYSMRRHMPKYCCVKLPLARALALTHADAAADMLRRAASAHIRPCRFQRHLRFGVLPFDFVYFSIDAIPPHDNTIAHLKSAFGALRRLYIATFANALRHFYARFLLPTDGYSHSTHDF